MPDKRLDSSKMPRVSKAEMHIARGIDDPDIIMVGAWEHCGALWYEKFRLSDFPNDLASLDDLERFGINLSDRALL